MLRVTRGEDSVFTMEEQRQRFISFCLRILHEWAQSLSIRNDRPNPGMITISEARDCIPTTVMDELYERWACNVARTCSKELLFSGGDALPKPLSFSSFSRYGSMAPLQWTDAAEERPAARAHATQEGEPDHDEGEDE